MNDLFLTQLRHRAIDIRRYRIHLPNMTSPRNSTGLFLRWSPFKASLFGLLRRKQLPTMEVLNFFVACDLAQFST